MNYDKEIDDWLQFHRKKSRLSCIPYKYRRQFAKVIHFSASEAQLPYPNPSHSAQQFEHDPTDARLVAATFT